MDTTMGEEKAMKECYTAKEAFRYFLIWAFIFLFSCGAWLYRYDMKRTEARTSVEATLSAAIMSSTPEKASNSLRTFAQLLDADPKRILRSGEYVGFDLRGLKLDGHKKNAILETAKRYDFLGSSGENAGDGYRDRFGDHSEILWFKPL